jgi:hypothetical protein
MTLHGQLIRSVSHDGRTLFFAPNLTFGEPKHDDRQNTETQGSPSSQDPRWIQTAGNEESRNRQTARDEDAQD